MKLGHERGSSHVLPPGLSCRPRNDTSHTRLSLFFTTPTGGGKVFFSPGNSAANEKLSQLRQGKATTLQNPSLFNWIFVYNSPSQLPAFHQ